MNGYIKKNKALIIIITTIMITASLLSGFIFGYFYTTDYGVRPEIDARAQNVILLIGDGMGINHIEIASLFGDIAMDEMVVRGTMTTRSLNLFPTDSAAAATALATGRKVRNKAIGYYKGKQITNLGELVKERGKKLGIITTKSVTDATPAAFTAHNKTRDNEQEIALEQIRKSQPDVLFGQGREFFDPYAEEINSEARGYYTNCSDLELSQKEQAFAIFEEDIPREGKGSLASLTQIALSRLDNEQGFFLMVEGAKIDSYSHDNDIDGMLNEFWGFNDAVNEALNYALINTNTTVIVVSDHETGKLELPKTMTTENIANSLYKSERHTARDVYFFVSGVGASEFPSKIDNTDIFYIIRQLLLGH